MSTMLEQAIIDAAALRETAMKSAEAALIEKYKDVFQETVEKLLEEETPEPSPAPTAEVDPATASANAADPTGPTLAPLPTGLGAAPQQGAPVDPNKKDVFKKVKSAFFDLEGDDEELITINFDQLKSAPEQQNSLTSQPASTMMEELELEYDELDEGLIVKIGEMYDAGRNTDASKYNEEDELEEGSDADKIIQQAKNSIAQRAQADAADKNKIAAAQTQKAKEQEKEPKNKEKPEEDEVQESIELTEDELLELEESLMVDMENVPEGYMGSHNRKEREFKKVANAKARDDKETNRREWAKKNLSDLQEALEKVATMYVEEKEKVGSLESSNQNLLTVVSTLKEQLEKMNLSNAKLLYTNKVLSNDSLNERQKNNIVENITKAESVSEAKTIYETLQSTVQSVSSQKTPKSLSEALNRGPSPFLVRKTQTASIEDLMSERMKRLAGIKV